MQPRTKKRKIFQDDFKIIGINHDATNIPQPPGAKLGIIPKHPFRMYIVGGSKSGKTNLLLNLLLRPNMYNGYFNNVLIISATARHLDPSYKSLDLDTDHYFPPDVRVLAEIQKTQEEDVKKNGLINSERTLVVMDDILSFKKFCRSMELLRFAVMSRHANISIMLLSQAYHNIGKTIRLQMSSIIFFKGSNKELKVLAEDYTPPGKTLREFRELVGSVTREPFQFLSIDLELKIEEGRYKQNFDRIII